MIRRMLLAIVSTLALCDAAWAQETRKAAVFPQLGHAGGISDVAYSPDQRLIASAGADGVKIWDVQSGRELITLSTAHINAVAFSPDGKLIASGGDDKKVQLWETATGREVRRLNGHTANICCVAFSPDGTYLATADQAFEALGEGKGGVVKVWNVASGQEVASVASPDAIMSVAISPDAKTVAYADEADHVWFLDLAAKQTAGASSIVGSIIAFSPDGKTLAAASDKAGISLWNVRDGRKIHSLGPSSGADEDIAFSPDGATLAYSGGSTLSIWNTKTFRYEGSFHSDYGVYGGKFSPDGREIVTSIRQADRNPEIVFLDASTAQQIRSLTGDVSAVTSVALSPDGATIAAGLEDGSVVFWSAADGRLIRRAKGHTSFVDAATFSPDGRYLATAGSVEDDTVKVWNPATGALVTTINLPASAPGSEPAVNAIATSPDSKSLAVGDSEGQLAIFDIKDGSSHTLAAGGDGVNALAFSKDGQMLASGHINEGVKLWDVETGVQIGSLVTSDPTDGPSYVSALAFSPDGRHLAVGGLKPDGDALHIFDLSNRQVIFSRRADDDWVTALAYAPDGKTLAATTPTRTVTLWDAARGQNTGELNGHYGQVAGVAYSPKGDTIVTGGADGTIRTWDAATDKERVALVAFTDGSSIAVTPEGYFDSSAPSAEENLNVRIGAHVYGISSFRERFYRPDLVRQSLAGQPIARLGTLDDVKLSPIVSLGDEPTTVTEPNLQVNVNLEQQDGGVGPVRVFWNGSAILQDASDPHAATRSYTVPLPRDASGANELRVTVQNADGSMWSEAKAVVQAKLAPRSSAPATLYALVVGINDFPKLGSGLSLNYSVTDAALIEKQLKTYAKGQFDNAAVKVLATTDETSKASILATLADIKAQLRPDDTFVLYFVSHGAVLKNGEYYLLTSSTTKDSVDGAISRRELSGLLADLPAVRKIAFIDACFSGSFGDPKQAAFATRGMNEQVAATLMGNDLGVTILMAGSSNDLALEGFQHQGLFTWVAANGLAGEAADPDRRITSASLSDYVAREVADLAKTFYGRDQQPTLVKPEKQAPFPIAMKEN